MASSIPDSAARARTPPKIWPSTISFASSGPAARAASQCGARWCSSGSAKLRYASPARSTRDCAETGAAISTSWPARRSACANGKSGPRWPEPGVEVSSTRMPPETRSSGPTIPAATSVRCSISAVARDQDVADQLGREQPVVDDPGRGREPRRDVDAGSSTGAEVVGDRAAVGARAARGAAGRRPARAASRAGRTTAARAGSAARSARRPCPRRRSRRSGRPPPRRPSRACARRRRP